MPSFGELYQSVHTTDGEPADGLVCAAPESGLHLLDQIKQLQSLAASNLMTVWEAAQFYANNDLWVFPLGSYKVPLKDSAGHLDASNDPATVRELFEQPGAVGIGINLHRSSLLVVDIDLGSGKIDLTSPLSLGGIDVAAAWDEGWFVGSRSAGNGGVHLFFDVSDSNIWRGADHPMGENSDGWKPPAGIGPGIDVKYNGYVVLPPTPGLDGGRRYLWEPYGRDNGHEPDRKAPRSVAPPLGAPEYQLIVQRLSEAAKRAGALGGGRGPSDGTGPTWELDLNDTDELVERVSLLGGQRAVLLREAMSLANRSFSEAEARVRLMAIVEQFEQLGLVNPRWPWTWNSGKGAIKPTLWDTAVERVKAGI